MKNNTNSRKLITPSPRAIAIAKAILPPGSRLSGVGPSELSEIYFHLEDIFPGGTRLVEWICRMLDLLSLGQTGRHFTSHTPNRQEELIGSWNQSRHPASKLVALLSSILKMFYFGRSEIHDLYGVKYNKAPEHPEPLPAYMQQVSPGYEVADEELEADVVVVGSGAAGAIVAKELAERGHAVLLVEAGKYYKRHDFTGLFLQASKDFYLWDLENLVVGNVMILLPSGKTVGGSTTINTATSFRPPSWVYKMWYDEGLPELSEEHMRPYFDDVEATLQVEPSPEKLWGEHVKMMSRFFDKKGISHGPILRNAPDCDGQSCCDMGCPSGGKYSMDLSYIPMALRHHAILLTETRLKQVLIRMGKVRGALLESGTKQFQVAARRVVLCCGALATPQIMWDHDLGGPVVGRYLTIHPTGSVAARFPRELHGYHEVIPSSHYVDHFADERMMLISANLPLDFAAVPFQIIGRELMREMEHLQYYGNWGVMIAETVKGRLIRLPGGKVICSYFMNQADVDQIQRGLALNCEHYFEAGAEVCYPSVRSWPVIRNRTELKRFRESKIKAGDLIMSAYHALGSCRMGSNPATSVVDLNYQVRGVQGLSIVDGSVVPGPIGVNSQITIMAFARRAADILDHQLES